MNSNNTVSRRAGRMLLAAILALSVSLPATGRTNAPDVRIGWTAWSDAEVISKMVALVLSRVGLDVELTLADVSVQYRGLAENDLDVMLMSWQPKTHAKYLREYGNRLEDLGTLYEGANLGLAVPAYVDASIQSIDDLAANADMFDGEIEGIGESAGITGLTKDAMQTYGLDAYSLKASSGPAMAQRLGKAVAEKRPIVVTAWRPHWKWAAYDLRYLDDPKGVYEGEESVHAMARKGFASDNPKVAAFLERMHFELNDLETLMAAAREKGHRRALRDWLNANSDRVRRWLEGD
ncbi:glycine betaine ABC transporter substrate-binding protein [Arhodomonas sp. AD133]|uniref:glycine betaine ABC transporter substrate-binding protein n=1 Tax=Arhodomonas sp. AD133 TaxID=3415009 RepID=UPI003EBBA177